MVAELELYGTPAQHLEALARLDAIRAERQQASVRIAPMSLSIAAASLAVAHVRNGTYQRAVQTSEDRAAKAARYDVLMDRAFKQMAIDREFRLRDPKGFIRSLRKDAAI